jgi:hypothetical protein
MLSHRDRRGTQPRPKIRPPLRGRPEKVAGYVGRLVRATSPACTALLAGGLLRTIPTIAGSGFGPWRARRTWDVGGFSAGDAAARRIR